MRSLALATCLPCIATAVLAAAGAPAHAERDPERRWRAEAGLGGLLGAVHLGDVSMFGSGMHIDLGARRDRLQLLGNYTLLSATESTTTMVVPGDGELPEPRHGRVHRFGGAVRGSLGRWGGVLRGDLWLELGLGREYMRLDGVGSRWRGDLALGFGGQFSGRLKKRLRLGVYYAFRGIFAEGDRDAGALPVCAAPCDSATKPFPVDRSFLFDIGFIVGT